MRKTIDVDFQKFCDDNPSIYTNLVSMARKAKAAGFSKYGIKGLFEVLRWSRTVETKTLDFKLNNNYTSRYARLIMSKEPDLKDFFETRELVSINFLPVARR